MAREDIYRDGYRTVVTFVGYNRSRSDGRTEINLTTDPDKDNTKTVLLVGEVPDLSEGMPVVIEAIGYSFNVHLWKVVTE